MLFFGKVGQFGLLRRLLSSPVCSSLRSKSSLWNPDYLEAAKSAYDEYPPVNIQIRGFDFAVLEKFQSRIHKVAKKMHLNISDTWAQEAQKLRVVRFKPGSELTDAEYIMNVYERNVQLSDVYSYQLPLLIDVITAFCPVGVNISVHVHEQKHFEKRFVPDLKVLELKKTLKEMNEEKKTSD